jgi:hypothetical protein
MNALDYPLFSKQHHSRIQIRLRIPCLENIPSSSTSGPVLALTYAQSILGSSLGSEACSLARPISTARRLKKHRSNAAS